ncbi:SixA phosphatase family protein [Marmoricola sp. RAF53]|uniref:SixA phosphatase family protein n=1 Tax=Marmoricola sp. RAF53 TaxID=3233059 RepID=UPI003F9B3C36
MRHAKAEAFAPTDHERVLTERGIADATDAGRWARDAGVLPDQALVSSAARTQETWDAFCEGAGCQAEAVVDPGIYTAGTDAALEILRTVDDDVTRLMIVGHNPTMASLVLMLDDGEADPEVFGRIASGYPTSALAVLEVSCTWADLDVAGARIRDVHVGRG